MADARTADFQDEDRNGTDDRDEGTRKADKFSKAREAAQRYKNYQSSQDSEGWGGADKKGDDNYIGPNELKAMQRDSGLSANEMNDFFSSEEGQQYFSKKHVFGGSGGKGGISNSDYLARAANAETNSRSAAKEKSQDYQHMMDNQNANSGGISAGNSSVQGASQRVNQDNDINASINGNNNTQNISQDNRVTNNTKNYGGDNSSFVYNGSSNGNNYEDTPVSAGTMAGQWSHKDTPAYSAGFMDRYISDNEDYQRKYQNPGVAQKAIDNAASNEAINTSNLDQRIKERAEATRARSTVMSSGIFGDMFGFAPTSFKSAAAQKPVEMPNFKS